MSLTQTQIINRAARLLQDVTSSGTNAYKRWLEAELKDYLYDAHHEFIRLTNFPIVTSQVTITANSSEFDRPGTGLNLDSNNAVVATRPPLMDLKRVRVSNTSIEIPIVTPSILDENTVLLGQVVNVDWRSQRGPIRAIVLEHASSSKFRLFPYPTSASQSIVVNAYSSGATALVLATAADAANLRTGMLISGGNIQSQTLISSIVGTTINISKPTTGATSGTQTLTFISSSDNLFSTNLVVAMPVYDVTADGSTDILTTGASVITSITDSAVLYFEGTIQPPRDRLTWNNAAADTDVPLISPRYHEALVYGIAERAYLKENELRNIEKSNIFRMRFMEYVAAANREEPQNPLTRNTGAAKQRIRLAWSWR